MKKAECFTGAVPVQNPTPGVSMSSSASQVSLRRCLFSLLAPAFGISSVQSSSPSRGGIVLFSFLLVVVVLVKSSFLHLGQAPLLHDAAKQRRGDVVAVVEGAVQ